MNNWRLGSVESIFANLIWDNAPISSGDLAKLASDAIGWKKTTSYTVLKRLCDRGIFQNQNGIITVLINRDDFYAYQSGQYVKESFSGSLPAFLVAFSRKKKLSTDEINELQRIIDDMRRK